MNETADQATSRLVPDSATNLTDLFIMLALERRQGTATASEISEMLAQFGIVISVDTINTRANPKRATKPFRKDGEQISFVNKDAAMQSHFLARAITAINARHSMMIPRRAFRYGASGFVRGTWTPSGFTAHWLDERETKEEEAARAKPMQAECGNWRI